MMRVNRLRIVKRGVGDIDAGACYSREYTKLFIRLNSSVLLFKKIAPNWHSSNFQTVIFSIWSCLTWLSRFRI